VLVAEDNPELLKEEEKFWINVKRIMRRRYESSGLVTAGPTTFQCTFRCSKF
jgi:hypothetical protein